MPLQTNFDFKHDFGSAGMQYGVWDVPVLSGIATEDIPLGRAVALSVVSGNSQQNGRNFLKLPDNGTGDTFLGITRYVHREPQSNSKRTPIYQVNSNEVTLFEINDAVPYSPMGYFYVEVTEAVTPGNSVFIGTTVNNTRVQDLGKFNTSSGLDISGNANWVTSTSGPGIAVLSIKLM